jgi:hypothetical protein
LVVALASAFGDLAFDFFPGQERLTRRDNFFSDLREPLAQEGPRCSKPSRFNMRGIRRPTH